MTPEVGPAARRNPVTLGTAQFGQAYGVANRVGAITDRAAQELVATAWEAGVVGFDTAAAYGESELVLGRALKVLGLAGTATVITKTQPLSAAELDEPAAATARITESVEHSLRRLRLDRLPVVLFHRDADARYLDVLLALRDRGLVERVGVSCGHDPGPAVALAGQGGVEALQLPANVLDTRHLDGGSFAAAHANRVKVFVRSVYLQGLLVMPEAAIPRQLAGVLPARRTLDRLSTQVGIPSLELVFRAMLSLPGRVSLLVGAETAAQVRANCTMAAAGPLPSDILALLASEMPRAETDVLTPASWQQLGSAPGQQPAVRG